VDHIGCHFTEIDGASMDRLDEKLSVFDVLDCRMDRAKDNRY
jgi:hypothetical protein